MASRKADALTLDLFLLLARRPHPQCPHLHLPHKLNPPTSTITGRRFASSSSSPPRIPRTDDRPLDRTIAASSKIPLNVGLDRNPDAVSAISRIPIPRGDKGEVFTPSVLARPLGLRNPPQPGQNSPLDKRSWAQRKADFTDPDKAKQRQRILMRSYFRPYYQERARARHFRGKSFVSNDRLFRFDRALYFPNIWGRTLSKDGDGPDGGRDLAPLLRGKISIITMESAHWAQEQVETFVGAQNNPDLAGIIASSGGLVQRINVNMQPSVLNMWLQKIFAYRVRKQIPQEMWKRCFVIQLPRDVRRGLTEDVRDAMGLLNSQVGYVYLVDSSAKIRWAGSGDAWDGEVAGFNAAIQRLLEEERTPAKSRIAGSSSAAAHQDELIQNIPQPNIAVV